MYIPKLLDVHSDISKCTFRRILNRIAQKREQYCAETGTVSRRNGNSIAKKREQYCEETGTVLRRNGNRIAKKREQYSTERRTVLRRNGNRIAKKRERCSEEILSKEKGDAKGTQIKTTGYNVCAERNLQKGHTLIILSAPP